MEATRARRWFSFILCIVLFAAAASVATGCGAKTAEDSPAVSEAVAQDGDVLGEGSTQFPLTITDGDGNEICLMICTDKTLVGEALQEVALIEGEEGPYGLYVKRVNGIRADYETDKTYWAFYINGEYAISGLDVTEITAGEVYGLKVERG